MLDEVKIYVRSGDGGDGLIAFRREKYVPRGGPSGGDGGRGGDVIIQVNPMMNTLIAFQKKRHFKADSGKRGGSSNKTGASGADVIIEVPPGTVVRDAETNAILADLIHAKEQFIALRGGRGGRGNSHFVSASHQTPRVAEKGEPGTERWLVLELKLIADIGIVGVPNAGKSTLLSVISNAKPKIAPYPFTTLEPNLGVIILDNQDLVAADIPGLIEGAHMGVGLGHSFLRHIQRTRALIHLLDGSSEDPLADYSQINAELALFDERLGQRPQIVVFNKMDLPDVQERWPEIQEKLRQRGVEAMSISAATRQNVPTLIQQMFMLMANQPAEIPREAVEIPTYSLDVSAPAFEIQNPDEGEFRVVGKQIERAAAMTYWDYEEAVMRFQKILETLGISDALKDAGVKKGDTVFIGDFELEWTD